MPETESRSRGLDTSTPAAGQGRLTELESLIRGRYSERSFLPKSLPLREIERILESALNAPSPSGRNPFYFAILQDTRLKGTFVAEVEQAFRALRGSAQGDPSQVKIIDYYERYTLFVRQASALLLCYTNDRNSALNPWTSDRASETANVLSLGAVLQNIGLLCTEAGIGHCILSAVVELFPRIPESLFPVPPHLTLRCLMSLGYPASAGRSHPKTIAFKRHIKVIG